MLGALLWCLAAPAAAAPARKPALHWTRGEKAGSCIDSRALAARVEALTGRAFVAPQDSEYAIEGHIDARPHGGFRVRLAVSEHGAPAAGERVLEHATRDCRLLDATLAFVIALTIDPDLELEALVPSAGLGERAPEEVLLQELTERPPTPAKPTAAARAPVKPTAAAKPVAARTPHWELAVGALYGARELPEPSLGLLVSTLYQGKRWLAASAQLRSLSGLRSTQLEPEQSMRTDAFAAALLACARARLWRQLAGGLCAGPEPELISARSSGFSEGHIARLALWGALASAELRWSLRSAWTFGLQGLVRMNLQNKGLYYSRASEQYEAPLAERVGVSVGLSVSYTLASRKDRAPVTHGQNGRERAP